MKLGPYKPNTIVHGSAHEVLSRLPDKCIDMVLTSPPYADMVDYGEGVETVGTTGYPEWLGEQLADLIRVCKPDAPFVFNIRDKVEGGFTSTYVIRSVLQLLDMGWKLWDVWFWFKMSAPPPALATTLQRAHNMIEYLYVFSVGVPYFNADAIRRPYAKSTLSRYKYIHHHTRYTHGTKFMSANPKGAIPTNLWAYPPSELPAHPAVMSLELCEMLVLGLSGIGAVVLDPFMGSGTTALAAKRMNRQWFGCDIKLEYVAMANARVNDLVQIGLGI